MDTEDQSWALGERCLICEDGAVVRRFWVYPADWQRMPAEELARFCQTARPRPTTIDRERMSEAG